MCTLVALHRCVPGAHLWVAANRDEYLARPAEGPALREGRVGAIVAPLDLHAGGTWWGVNALGLFAAVTNRPTSRPDPARRSRGQLVLDVLAADSAHEAAERAAALPPARYNPFNLFLADANDAFALVYEDTPRLLPLAPGVHVVGNADPDARNVPKIRRTLERAEQVAGGPAEAIRDGLAAICRTHGDHRDPIRDTCVHLGAYGTRSSSLLRLTAAGDRRLAAARSDLLEHAAGPPCTSPYQDFTPLLSELSRTARPHPGETATRKAS
jgi:uncharacterized protein with NRDE domain